jgi:hypothetical protein
MMDFQHIAKSVHFAPLSPPHPPTTTWLMEALISMRRQTSAQHDLKSIMTESSLQNIPTWLRVGFCE